MLSTLFLHKQTLSTLSLSLSLCRTTWCCCPVHIMRLLSCNFKWLNPVHTSKHRMPVKSQELQLIVFYVMCITVILAETEVMYFGVFSCLQYKYLSLDEFPSISSNDANCRPDNHLPRPCHTEKITPRHPSMAICSGNDVSMCTHKFSQWK